MRVPALLLLLLAAAIPSLPAHAASPQGAYAPQVTGTVGGFRLAGIEPDGDPLDQVALRTRLAPSAGVPALHLIVDAYLENFQPDTTPILPDLLHPNQTATNLGGFLQGKVILTDDAGDVLYLGDFLAEAFFNNDNHAVMRFTGMGAAKGGSGSLKGVFRLHQKTASLHGSFSGQIVLPAAARRQLAAHAGATMKPLQQILNSVTVKPAPMRGRATTGTPGAPLHTGYGPQKSVFAAQPSGSSRHLSPLTIGAALGAVASFLLAGFLFWSERRRERNKKATARSGAVEGG